MPEDLAAAIAQQIEALKQREAVAHRFEGVLVENIPAKVRAEQADLESWKLTYPEPAASGDEFDLQLRELKSPQAAAAYSLACTLGKAISPLSETGTPLVPATHDLPTLVKWWSPDGPYVDRWPGVPTGPESGFFGLVIYGPGSTWLKQAATVHRPSKIERMMSFLSDPIDALGVPKAALDPWGDDEEERPRPDEVRPTLSAPLLLVEKLPPFEPITTAQAWRGSIRSLDAQRLMIAAKGRQPRQMGGQVWAYPAAASLPIGRRLREGVFSLSAIPAFGTILKLDDLTWEVRHFPSQLQAPPSWLVEAIQKL